MNYTTVAKRKGMYWMALVMVAFLVSSSSLVAPTTAFAQNSEVAQFGPGGYLPLLVNNDCSGRRSEANPIGTQVYGASGATRDDFEYMQNSMTAWARVSISWRNIEPTNRAVSAFNWANADAALLASVDNCANLVVTIDETTDWATTDRYRSPIQTDFLDDFVEFVVAVVERYDGDGIDDAPNGAVANYFEFYNEPDFGNEVPNPSANPGGEGWGEHGVRYAQMLEMIYEPVHDANPKAKVVFGGIAYNLFANEGGGGLFVRGFFQSVLDAGGGDYFDIMNFHYYPFNHNRTVWTEGNASGLREKYEDLHAKMVDAGIGDKPVMLTEIGWHSRPLSEDSPYPSSQEYQARRVVELITQAKALRFKTIIWWALGDLAGAFPYETGLLTPDVPPSPKPAYDVYLEMMDRVGTATFVSNVILPTTDNDLEAYRFREAGTNKTFYVAWLNPVAPFHIDLVPDFNDNETQNLQVDGEIAEIYSKEGVLKQTIQDADDGANDDKVTVAVGRNPLYIEIN